MIVKFFGNKKGGSSASVNYLLNEREAQGTAKVLQGDPQLTKDLINSITHKQKVTVGCLSFEENNISQEQKYKLMKDFENHLLPGMQDRYNILWVEHTDKGRLELNFVIPKIDLESQKTLNPYYHKADLPRVEKWQDLQNLQYGYSNPKDPSKARTLETNPKEIGLSQDYEQLDKLLHNQNLQSRSHLIELLESNNITVTRKGKDYLSIKLPDSKKAKKFKGGIYSEQFRSPEQLRELSQAIRKETKQFNQRDTQRECERLSTELKSYTQDKERKLRKQYIEAPRKDRRTNTKTIESSLQTPQRRTLENGRESNREDRREREAQVMANSDTINLRNANSNSRDNVLHNNSPREREQHDILLGKRTQVREDYDSTRTATNGRTGTRETKQYRDYREARQSRVSIHKELTEQSKKLRESTISNSRELSTEHRAVAPRISSYDEGRERELLTEAGENIRAYSRIRGIARGIKERFGELKSKITEIGNKFNDFFEGHKTQSERDLREVTRAREVVEERSRPRRSYGYSMSR